MSRGKRDAGLVRAAALGAMALAAACVPYVAHDYKISAPHSTTVHNCGMGSNDLYFELPKQIRVNVLRPGRPGQSQPVSIAIEIPAGHTVRLTDNSVAVLSGDADSTKRTVAIIADGGYRYLNPESSQTSKDPEGGSPTRELAGSTWNTHRFGEQAHSFYYFNISNDAPWPDRFSLRLPPMVVDGVTTQLPTVTFEFGAHPGVSSLGCS
jgi:hypothetical protein